jgi:hypothetical protein
MNTDKNKKPNHDSRQFGTAKPPREAATLQTNRQDRQGRQEKPAGEKKVRA